MIITGKAPKIYLKPFLESYLIWCVPSWDEKTWPSAARGTSFTLLVYTTGHFYVKLHNVAGP